MPRTALVTGSPARVVDVADALTRSGFDVLSATTADEIAKTLDSLAEGALACYVQLPKETVVSGQSLIGRVRQFLAEGLLARFETAEAVLPLLAPEASVLLVAGNVPGGATPDDRHARIDLLRVLARAILAERPDDDLRAVVVGHDRSAAEVAALADRRGDESRRRRDEVAALSPDLDYEDWQREVLRLTTEE